MKFLLFLLMLFMGAPLLYAQKDSIPPTIIDTVRAEPIQEIETYADTFVPRRASLYSAVFPGGGQIYNKKYWKLPIVYGGFIALGMTVDFYNDLYQDYRSQLFTLLDDPTYRPPSGASESQLRSAIDDARRERDFWMVMTGVLYLLQIAEAHIDAHLKEFALNPNLQVSIKPMAEPSLPGGVYQTGLTLTIHINR
jgi:hypothetical protein